MTVRFLKRACFSISPYIPLATTRKARPQNRECSRPTRVDAQYSALSIAFNCFLAILKIRRVGSAFCMRHASNSACCKHSAMHSKRRTLFSAAHYLDFRRRGVKVLVGPCRRLITYPGSLWRDQIRVGSGSMWDQSANGSIHIDITHTHTCPFSLPSPSNY